MSLFFAHTTLSTDSLVRRDLPRRPEIAVDELHCHLAINNLDDVHCVARSRPPLFFSGRVAAALRTDASLSLSTLSTSDFRCTGDTRGLLKPFVPVWYRCVRAMGEKRGKRGREKEKERARASKRISKRKRERERGERKRDIRMRKRISGVPLLQSR